MPKRGEERKEGRKGESESGRRAATFKGGIKKV